MDKFCIFCGARPEEKSAEHVIPKWLIELTGNPKRKAYFGYEREIESRTQRRTFSFDSLRFPSCASCNQKYSDLEARTKSIIEKMLAYDYLSASEINTLLDWFDKVRVGLWLGYLYLDKNPAGIKPKFYIEKRIGINDRMLAVFKAETDHKGLTFIGCDLPSFTFTPSCFSIRINNLCFLNMSYNDLFSRRIGFPFPIESFAMPEQQQLGTYTKGRNRVMAPLLKRGFTIKGIEIYQPMFRNRNLNPTTSVFYDTQYIRENSMLWEQGIGKIFLQDSNKLSEYPLSPSKKYIPNATYDISELLFKIQVQTIEWQAYIDKLAPSLENLPVEEKRGLSNHRMQINKLNQELIQVLQDKLENSKS